MTIRLPTSPQEIADDFLRDIELGAIAAGITDPPIQEGTDWYVLSHAIGQHGFQIAGAVQQADADGSVLTATGDSLDDIREAEGLEEITGRIATGNIVLKVTGTSTVLDGEPGKIGSVRYKVLGNWIGVTDGAEISVVSVDTGTAANAPAGTAFLFDAAPLRIDRRATVSSTTPITGGKDKEKDAEKQARILEKRRNTPAGGNVGHVRQLAFKATGAVQNVFVYPALGGPASQKIVPLKAIEPELKNFSRLLSSTQLATVRGAIQSELPMPTGSFVENATEQPVDMAILLDLPDSALKGGNGTGWVDYAPWPIIGTATRAVVTAVTTTSQITITTGSITPPVAGMNSICWWSKTDQCFRTYLITAVTAGGGGGPTWTYLCTVDRPMVDSANNPVAVDDLISPAAVNLEKYGNSWRSVMGKLGPGENTTDVNRIPFALRRPLVTEGPQCDLNAQLLNELQMYPDPTDPNGVKRLHPEIAATAWSYRSATTPTVPATVLSPPNVLTLRHLGIYPL